MYNDYNHKEVAKASRIGLCPSGLRWKKSRKKIKKVQEFDNILF